MSVSILFEAVQRGYGKASWSGLGSRCFNFWFGIQLSRVKSPINGVAGSDFESWHIHLLGVKTHPMLGSLLFICDATGHLPTMLDSLLASLAASV